MYKRREHDCIRCDTKSRPCLVCKKKNRTLAFQSKIFPVPNRPYKSQKLFFFFLLLRQQPMNKSANVSLCCVEYFYAPQSFSYFAAINSLFSKSRGKTGAASACKLRNNIILEQLKLLVNYFSFQIVSMKLLRSVSPPHIALKRLGAHLGSQGSWKATITMWLGLHSSNATLKNTIKTLQYYSCEYTDSPLSLALTITYKCSCG